MTTNPEDAPGLWRDKREAWREVMPGVMRRIVSNSPHATVILYKTKPGVMFSMHTHAQPLHQTFLSGSGEMVIEDSKWEIRQGDGYYIPANVKHELSTSKTEDCVVLDVYAPPNPGFLSELLKKDF
jgi:mannose-6-phosphate isomerase-like protein (cupin superfamily)